MCGQLAGQTQSSASRHHHGHTATRPHGHTATQPQSRTATATAGARFVRFAFGVCYGATPTTKRRNAAVRAAQPDIQRYTPGCPHVTTPRRNRITTVRPQEQKTYSTDQTRTPTPTPTGPHSPQATSPPRNRYQPRYHTHFTKHSHTSNNPQVCCGVPGGPCPISGAGVVSGASGNTADGCCSHSCAAESDAIGSASDGRCSNG